MTGLAPRTYIVGESSLLGKQKFNTWPWNTSPWVLSGTVTEDKSVKFRGAASAKCAKGASNYTEWSRRGVVGRSYFSRGYLRLGSVSPSENMVISQVFSPTNGTLIMVSLSKAGEITVWNNKAGSNIIANSGFLPSINKWYCFEYSFMIAASGANSVFQLKIRNEAGVLLYNSGEKTGLEFGNAFHQSIDFGRTTATETNVDIWVDEVEIRDGPVGEENWPGPLPIVPSGLKKAYWGASVDGDAYSTGQADAPYSESTYNAFESNAGRSMGIVHFSDKWNIGEGPVWDGFGKPSSSRVKERGAIPMKTLGGPENVIKEVNEGKYDTSLEKYGEEIAAFAWPVFIRPWWEFNGTWWPWGRNKCTPAEFKEAWIRLVTKIKSKCSNAAFYWCANIYFDEETKKAIEERYPGDSYVDWVGFDGYSGENPIKKEGAKYPFERFEPTYTKLIEVAPTKPQMIGEVSTSEIGVNKPAWIAELFSQMLPVFSRIKAVVWYNAPAVHESEGVQGRVDWQIESSSLTTESFKEVVEPEFYIGGSQIYGSEKPPVPGDLYEGKVLEDNPIMYWRENEVAPTTTLIDWSGNERNGTLVNSPIRQVSGGPSGSNAITFNGTSQYASIPDSSLIDFGDTMTYELWFKRTAVQKVVTETLIQKGSNAVKVVIQSNAKILARVPSAGNLFESTIAIEDTNWHHLVFTKSGVTSKLYIDGVDRTGAVTNFTASNTTSPLILGAEGEAGTEEWFNGKLDEVAVYPIALSEARVKAHYENRNVSINVYQKIVKEDGPHGYWRMEEESGLVAADASNRGRTGTIANSPTLGQTGLIPGSLDTAFLYNGGTSEVKKSYDSGWSFTNEFSLEAWIKITEDPIGGEDERVIMGRTGGGWAYAAGYVKSTRKAWFSYIDSTGATVEIQGGSIEVGGVYHIVAIKTPTKILLYVNEKLVAEKSATNSVKVNELAEWKTGHEGAGGATGFQGVIDEIAVYSTALSEDRVKDHFQTGLGEITFIQEVNGSSISISSEIDSFTMEESVSGSALSSGSQSESLVLEEPVSGVSGSLGEITFSSEESIAMTLNGESSSNGEIDELSEASEPISGSSGSSGSESDNLNSEEIVNGSSTSSGSQEQVLFVVDSVSGSSTSSFAETDEAISANDISGSSASSGIIEGLFESMEDIEGSSSSSGSLSFLLDFADPIQPVSAPVEHRGRRRPVVWKFMLIDSDTMEELGEIKRARGKQLQLALDKPGGCNFTVPIDYDLFKDVEEINHGIIAYRNKQPRYSGMIWNLDESVDGNSIAVQSVGWFETLNHRIIRENVGYPPFSTGVVNAGQIVFMPAQGTVGSVNYHPGGLLTMANAQQDTWLVEGISTDIMQRIISYQKGQNIGQAITQLSEIEAGFDFWVDSLTRVLDLTSWSAVPDKTESVVFGYNWGNKNIKQLGRQFDPSVMANRVTALGKYGGGFAEDIESQQKYQLFEEMTQLNDVVDPNVLLGFAGGEVLLRKQPRVLYSFTPFPYSGSKRVPEPFEDYDIGDIVSFTAVRPPRVDIRGQAVRIYGMNIDVTDEGNEKVSALQISP